MNSQRDRQMNRYVIKQIEQKLGGGSILVFTVYFSIHLKLLVIECWGKRFFKVILGSWYF